ncbi:molybdenum ABC transporter permease subunit [Candidatus Formimonas warabiya]|uniref:Molybdenum transport system permease n=2 Tax=Formimonas warabiya TaxID=1761012 RepID=A0A3G1KR21_FORW1|nr:molybdate ABC transporter permease subunit [Candidatus Formimonas warabiya]ATW24919.1 molybdenum ABC transporter permease subunit [Candidatus Formimonas warabiya]
MTDLDFRPLLLSLKVSTLATFFIILIGTPIGFVLARAKFKGKSILDSLFTLPLVLPPTVLGYYLLVAIGRQSPLGKLLENQFGINLVFTWQAAVIAAFFTSFPLLVRSAKAAFAAIDPNMENAARTLGRSELSIFFTVTIPLAWKGLMAGVVLAFARALGDFGTTMMVAGNIPGKTQTMPIAIYDAVIAGNTGQANVLVLVMTLTAIIIIIVLNTVEQKY